MKLHFFEDYIKTMFEQGKIDNMFPDDKGNIQICCPFPHKKEVFDEQTWETKTIEYYEVRPSSSINLEKRCFNCFVCNNSHNEIDFAQAVTGKDKESIIREYTTKEELQKCGLIEKQDTKGATKVLKAAAFTYVAGFLASALQIARLLLISRNRD